MGVEVTPLSTIALLHEWAKWGSSVPLGYPSRAAFFGERALKTPLYGVGHIPPEIEAVEKAVCAIDWNDRQILILRYQRKLSWAELGEYLGVSRWTAGKRIKGAENAVHHKMSQHACENAPTAVLFV